MPMTPEQHREYRRSYETWHADRLRGILESVAVAVPESLEPVPKVAFGLDSNEQPAAWFYYKVRRPFAAGEVAEDQLAKFAKALQEAVIQSDPDRFPHVRFVDEFPDGLR